MPGGSNPITQLHQNEMVLPAGISQGLQSMIAGGGSSNSGSQQGSNVNITIQAVDAQSVQRLFNDNRSALMTTIKAAATYQPSTSR